MAEVWDGEKQPSSPFLDFSVDTEKVSPKQDIWGEMSVYCGESNPLTINGVKF